MHSLSAARASALSLEASIFSLESSRYEPSSDTEIFTGKVDHRLKTQHLHFFVSQVRMMAEWEGMVGDKGLEPLTSPV